MSVKSPTMQNHFVDGYQEPSVKAFDRKRKLKLYVNMGLLIISATANIIVQQYQNVSLVSDSNGNLIEFNHPYFQTLIYQLAELMAFGIYYIQVKILKITDECPEDVSQSIDRFSHLMKRNRKKTLIGSMISSMVGSPT